jgi:hypothetical protein
MHRKAKMGLPKKKIRLLCLFGSLSILVAVWSAISASGPQAPVPHQWVNLDDVVSLDFLSVPGRVYRLEYTTDLTDPGNWVPSETVITGTGTKRHAFDPHPSAQGKCYRIVLGNPTTAPAEGIVQAEHCAITALDGHFACVPGNGSQEVLVSTDSAEDPTYAMGEIKFNFPGVVANGTYRLTVYWRTGTVAGTPWGFMLGSDTGSVTENGTASGNWHYFYPGQSGPHSDQWFTKDLAGSNPVSFSMWVNSPVASSITVTSVGPGDFYVRVWDMSPSRDNYFAIDYFELSPLP